MKTKISGIIGLLALVAGFTACDTDSEPKEIQKLTTYDDQYYANLRDYHNSDHAVFYGYYAAYGPGEKYPASWGQRIIGLPDSIDIINLWEGVPNIDPNSTDYNPLAYSDMRFCQEKKGMKFVLHKDAAWRWEFVTLDGDTINCKEMSDEDAMRAYADIILDEIYTYGVDGVDLDYEPRDYWADGGNKITLVCQYLAEKIGPTGEDPSKLLIVDYFSTTPPAEIGDICNYWVCQAYGCGNANSLQNRYDAVSGSIPPEKWICCEQLGDYRTNAGVAFTEADGNTITSDFWAVEPGSRMYSLEGFARWNPTQGRKGGFGGYYFEYDYYHRYGPYHNVRRSIQLCNPAVHK